MLATGTLIVGLSVFGKLALPETPCFIFYWVYYIGYLIWVYSFVMRCIKIQYLFKWNLTKLKKGGNWKVNIFKSQKETSKSKSDAEKHKHFTSFHNNYVYSSSRFQRSLKLPTNRFNTSFLLFLLLVFLLLLITLLSIPQFMSEHFSLKRKNCAFGGIVDYLFMLIKIVFYIIACPMFFFVILEVNESFGVKHILFVTILLGIPSQLFEYIPQIRLSDTYAEEYSNTQIYYCILDVVIMLAVHIIDVIKPVIDEYNITVSFSRFLLKCVHLKKHSNDQPVHSDSGFDTFERVMNVPQLFKSFKYFCVTDYAIVDIIFYERWRDIREQVLLYNYYKNKVLDGPSSSRNKYGPSIYNIDNTMSSKGMTSSNTITQPRMRSFANVDTVTVHSDYTYINNNNTTTSQTSQASSTFSDNFQPIYYFDDNKTPLNKMPDVLIPPCLLPLFIGLYQTFINSGSIFELNDIPIDKLERLSNQIMYSPLYYHFISNVSNNKNLESSENLSNNIEELDDDEDNNYNLDRYTKHAQLIYSQASSYETINSMGSSRQDLSNDLKSYQSSASTKVMTYSHTGYAMLQSNNSNMTSTMTNTMTNNSMTNTNISTASARNMPGQPRCLFNYEDMNFEEDNAMSLEINLSCTIFDEILDTIYHRIYEYSYFRFISDSKNRKIVHSTLKNIHKQRKRRKNGRSNTGMSRNTSSQNSNSASCSHMKDSSSSRHHHHHHHHHHVDTSSTGSFVKFNDSSNKSYSSHHTHSRSGHHNYTQSFSGSNNSHSHHHSQFNSDYELQEKYIDKECSSNGNGTSNLKYNTEDINYDSGSSGKLFVVGHGNMNENQINNTQTTFEIINKDNKVIPTMNTVQNDNMNTIPLHADQENCFNTYPMNSSSNKGKGPYDTINSDLNQYSDSNLSLADEYYQNTNNNSNNHHHPYDNIPSVSNSNKNNYNNTDTIHTTNTINPLLSKNNNNATTSTNSKNVNNKNNNHNNNNSSSSSSSKNNNKNNSNNNESQMKLLPMVNGTDPNNFEGEHYSYHDDLSVFWESEDENEENVSINESISEEELMTPQLRDERSSDLFRKNMESFRQKLLGSSTVRDRQNSSNSTSSSINNGNTTNTNNNPLFSNLVTSVKRRSSNLSNLIFNHQNRDTNNAIELKSLDAYNLS
ncbi:hypothetical protein PIROE2DRAFT_4982 [Piromyces sp. E2]|nr:hypothetical protein PIROE2DRAFT_4982 [Piromyces sp. E2]|eukprot:OUM67574.1 hypothetical protein PIROE2DRAFT_4982 [Piromyces sp. E2]